MVLRGGKFSAVMLEGGVVDCGGGAGVLDSGTGSCSTTPCISAGADQFSSDWFFFPFLLFPVLATPKTGVVELATGDVGGLGGLVLLLDFGFFLGQEEELCLTTLQVRQVFGARGHQAKTFVPRTSKMVGGAVEIEGLISITRSQRRVSQGLPGMRCGAISFTSPNCFQWLCSTDSRVTAEAIGTFASFTRMKRGAFSDDGIGGREVCPFMGRGLDRSFSCSSFV